MSTDYFNYVKMYKLAKMLEKEWETLLCMASRFLGLISYSSYCCCGQFHIGFEQLGTSVTWQSRHSAQRVLWLSAQRSSDSEYVCPAKGLAITYAQCLRGGRWTNRKMTSLFTRVRNVWYTPEGFLELLWIKQTIFPWGSQFNNIFLD